MSRTPRSPAAAALSSLACLVLVACTPAGAQPRTAYAPEGGSTERNYGSHTTVGLRVHLDPETEDEPRVHLVAVVRDIHGEEQVHDLGEYEGTATEETPLDGELVRLRLANQQSGGVVSVRHNEVDGHLEVHHAPDSGEPATVRRIPLRSTDPVRASDVRVEHRRGSGDAADDSDDDSDDAADDAQ